MSDANHKHCVYCGESSADSLRDRTACIAPNNPLRQDTVGNKAHVYLGNGWPPDRVQFYKPKPRKKN